MKKQGFTLAELLGVIIIISLLLILIVPTIVNKITKSKQPAKVTGNEIIFNAVDQYMSEHSSKYPKGKNGTYCILIKDLIDDGKLLEPVKDISTGEDISNKSVKVAIYNEGNINYEITENDKCEPLTADEMITFIVNPKTNKWVKQRKVTIVFPKKDSTYKAKYRIKKCDCHGNQKNKCEQTCNSEWKEVDIDSKVGGNVDLTFDWTSKSSILEARYVDTDNAIALNATLKVINIDVDVPDNFNISNSSNGNWTNKDVNITLSAKDEDSGIDYWYYKNSNTDWTKYNDSYEKKSYSITYKNNMNDTINFKVCDKADNCSQKNTTVKIDKTAPTNFSISNSSNGNWTNKDVNITLSAKDNESGIDYWYYKYSNTNWTKYSDSYGKTSYSLTLNNNVNKTIYFKVCDKAGNCSEGNTTVKIDKTAPINFSVSNSSNGNWTNSNVNITLSAKDNESGIDYWYYKYSNTDWTKYSDSYGKTSYSLTLKNDINKTIYFKACDKAGNCTQGSTVVRIDKTAPTKPVINNPYANKWSYDTIYLTVSSSDSGSGLGYWYYKYNSTDWIRHDNSKGKSPYTPSAYSAERNENTYIRVCDNVGNCSESSSTPIRIDRCNGGYWTGCSASCGGGTQTHIGISGRNCGTRSCNTQSCSKTIYLCRAGKTCINVVRNIYDCTYTARQYTTFQVEDDGGGWYKIKSGGYSGYYIRQKCTSTSRSACSSADCSDI